MKKHPNKILSSNRKALFNYHVVEQIEAGVELLGSEVKSCISGNLSISEAYCIVRDCQLYLIGANIAGYANSSYMNHNPTRERRLLVHRSQISRLKRQVEQKGMAIVPLDFHVSENGRIKVQISLCKGKSSCDKRNAIKEREARMDMTRAVGR